HAEDRDAARRGDLRATIVHRDEIFEVHDTPADDRFTDNPSVTRKPYIRFYAGVPLRGGRRDAVAGALQRDLRHNTDFGSSSAKEQMLAHDRANPFLVMAPQP